MKASQNISFVDDEFGDDFISSWKPSLDFEDDERTADNCKTSFSLQKMDMDFEFDGGLKALSSFNVDISDLVAFPSKSSKAGSNGEKNPEACESIKKGNSKFCFEFDGLDDFDLEATLKTNTEPTSRIIFSEKGNGDEEILEKPGQETEERDRTILDNTSMKEVRRKNPSWERRSDPTTDEASMDKRSIPLESQEQTILDVLKGSRRILDDEPDSVTISSSDVVIKVEAKNRTGTYERDIGNLKESTRLCLKKRPIDTPSPSNSEAAAPNSEVVEKSDTSSEETDWLSEKVHKRSLQEDGSIKSPKMSTQLGMKSRRGQDMEAHQNGSSGNAKNVEKLLENKSFERQSCANMDNLEQGRNELNYDSSTAKKQWREHKIILPEIRSVQSKENCIVKSSDSNKSLQRGQTSSKTLTLQSPSPRFVTGTNLQRSTEFKPLPPKSESVFFCMDNSKNQKSGLSLQPNKRNIQQVLELKSGMNYWKNTIAKRTKTIETLGGNKPGLALLGRAKSAEPTRVASQKAFKFDLGPLTRNGNSPQAKTNGDNTMETMAISSPDKSAPENRVKNLETMKDSSKTGTLQHKEDNAPAIVTVQCDDKIEEKAERYANQLDHLLKMLKRKHEEAMDLRVRALVINNTLIVMNNPVDEEKILKITSYIHEKLGQKC